MISALERSACRAFRGAIGHLPNGSHIPDPEPLRPLCAILEGVVVEVLAGAHPEAADACLLDGIYPIVADKVAHIEVEIFGLCIFLSDQRMTPIHLRFQLGDPVDEFSWIDLKLGERRGSEMGRLPYPGAGRVERLLHAFAGRENDIDWFYHVGFGERRS